MRRTFPKGVIKVLLTGVMCIGMFLGFMLIISDDSWMSYISCDKHWKPGEIEFNSFKLLVAAMMKDPETPVHELMTDPKLACGDGGCVTCDEDPINDECTNDLWELITLSDSLGEGENDMVELNWCSSRNIMKNYFCVHPDGTVEGFLEDGTSIRDV